MTSVAIEAPRAINTRSVFLQSLVVGAVLTGLSYVVGLAAGWVDNPGRWTILEAFAVFTSYACTYMCVKESRFNYPIGAVSTFAYAFLFLHYDLLASAVLNFYLTFQLVYGWFRWRSDTNTKPVQHVGIKWLPAYLVVTVAAYFIALGIVHAAGGHLATTDSIILVFTILAQFLLDNKKVENWFVWMVVNVFAIYTYFHADLNLAGFQYIFFLGNAFWGYYAWRKNLVSNEVTV